MRRLTPGLLHDVKTAIDHQSGAGDERRFGRCQPNDRPGDFFRAGPATDQRGVLAFDLELLDALSGVLGATDMEIGKGGARADGVRTDPVCGFLECQRPCVR